MLQIPFQTHLQTLPKALRTQALTTLTSFVGLVWLSMFGLVDLVW